MSNHSKVKPLPIPDAPKRSLTPPAQKYLKEVFDTESPTPTKNKTLSIFQSLLSVFDEMNDEQRVDLIEIAFLVKSLSEEDRKWLLDVLIYRVFDRKK